jgi:hypothetical protein
MEEWRYISMVKSKLSLYLQKNHAIKTYWGSGGIAPRILTSALDGEEWSALLPTEKTSRLDEFQKRSVLGGECKTSLSLLVSNSGHPAHSLVTVLTEEQLLPRK